MAGETAARQLLAEYEERPTRQGASALGFLGIGPSVAVADRLAYAHGRGGKPISEHLLKAKIAEINEGITRHLYGLMAEYRRLKSQKEDILAQGAYIVAVFFGLAVLGLALYVDYKIIHEFWARAVMDEFGHMPRGLASSVTFKSAQVVFATLAFHFMLEAVGDRGRKVFVLFIFALTFTMLLGIGLIIANNWLPPGSQLFGVDLHAAANSGRDVLAALGLPSQNAVSQDGSFSASDVKTVQTLVWLGSLSLIFIIVTGVGSLSLRNAVHNFQKLAGAETNDLASPGAAGLRGSRNERLEQLWVRAERYGISLEKRSGATLKGNDGIGHADEHHTGNRGREASERSGMIRKHLLDFANSYAAGLHDYQSAYFGLFSAMRGDTAKTLLKEFGESLQPLMGGYIEEYVEKHLITQEFLEQPRKPDFAQKERTPFSVVPGGGRRSGTDDI